MARRSGFAKRRGAVVATVLSLALIAACNDAPEGTAAPAPLKVLVTPVIVQDVPVIREWVGETRGRADVEIRARVRGFLEEIHFTEGGHVKKGDLLYSIDQAELLQDVAAARADLAAAQTELAYAWSDERRYRPLAEMNAVSVRDLDSAVAYREAAEARVEAAKALLNLAEINLSYSRIRAPMDGIIGLTKAKVGDYVGQSPNPVVLNTVSDTDPIHVRFPIGEREYLEFARRYPPIDTEGARRKTSDQVALELILADGTTLPDAGRALYSERNVDASTGTITIEAAFPNGQELIRPGQYGRVRAQVDTLVDALLVPQRAVLELQGQYQVWVIGSGNTADLRSVRMGRRVDQSWVVEDGLQAGEQVVVEGIQRLRAGVAVTAEPWEPPPAPEEAVTGS